MNFSCEDIWHSIKQIIDNKLVEIQKKSWIAKFCAVYYPQLAIVPILHTLEVLAKFWFFSDFSG